MKVLISGGGIAGLTMGIALRKKGFETEIFESSPVLGPVGAGIAIGANAVKVLRLLGMEEEFRGLANKMEKAAILDRKGKEIMETISIRLKDGRQAEVFAVHRADLHELLHRHYTGELHTGSKGISREEKNGKVILHLGDGRKAEGDFLVAADGIHSPLRHAVLPGSRLRYSGLGCWRGVTDHIPPGIAKGLLSETWGPKGRFGIVPVGGNRVYWFATCPARQGDEKMKSMKAIDLKEYYAGYHSNVHKILDAALQLPVLYNELSDLEPIGNFAFGRMALAGDAAHATTPNLGQGACQAMEDALVLSHCLAEQPDEEGLRSYSALRLPRTTTVVNRSWSFGRIAENTSPVLSGIRNAVFRMVPPKWGEKQMRFLFDIDFPGWS